MINFVICVLMILCNETIDIHDDQSSKNSEYLNDLNAIIETEELRAANELFNQKEYDEAFSILKKAMIQYPKLQKNFVVAMCTLLVQAYNEDDGTLSKIYLRYAKEVLPLVNKDAKNVLITFISEKSANQKNYEDAKLYADTLIEALDKKTVEYADIVYEKAIIAINHNKYEEALPLLEELWENKDFYPDEIQYRNGLELFNAYVHFNNDDSIIKVGEEVRTKLNKNVINDINDVDNDVSFLQNLAEAYRRKKMYKNAYELYDEAVKLLDKYLYLCKDYPTKTIMTMQRDDLDGRKNSLYKIITNKEMENNKDSMESNNTTEKSYAEKNSVGGKIPKRNSFVSHAYKTPINKNNPSSINPTKDSNSQTEFNPTFSLIAGVITGFLVGIIVIVLIKLLRKYKT